MIVADGHSHSNPARGLGARQIAERFKEAGGWFIALVSLSPSAYGIEEVTFESYVKAVQLHAKECRVAREVGLKVACIAGFHPAEIDRLVDKHRLSVSRALELGERVIGYVADLVRAGELDGIGEVGRQHYRTVSERVVASHIIMELAIEMARDLDAVVHLHLEQSKEDTVAITDRAISRLRPARSKVIFHHSDPKAAAEALKRGYSATVSGLRQPLEHALSIAEPLFMVESDYIDDPSRPGVVAYPWQVASLVRSLAKERPELEERLYKINVDAVERAYGVAP